MTATLANVVPPESNVVAPDSNVAPRDSNVVSPDCFRLDVPRWFG